MDSGECTFGVLGFLICAGAAVALGREGIEGKYQGHQRECGVMRGFQVRVEKARLIVVVVVRTIQNMTHSSLFLPPPFHNTQFLLGKELRPRSRHALGE